MTHNTQKLCVEFSAPIKKEKQNSNIPKFALFRTMLLPSKDLIFQWN